MRDSGQIEVTGKLVDKLTGDGIANQHVKATFAGDAVRQLASAEGTLDLTAATTTTMRLAASKLAYEDDLVITGKISDEDGKPVARAAVTLTSGDKRLAQGASGDDGEYRFKVEAALL